MIRHIASFAACFTLAAACHAAAEPAPAAPVAAPAAEAAQPAIPGKLGFVDMEKLFQNYYKTLSDDASFKMQKDSFLKIAGDMKTRLEIIQKQAVEARERSTNFALSQDAQKAARQEWQDKAAEFDAKERELREFVREKNDVLGAKYMELRNNIARELAAFVGDHGQRNRYELLLDSSGLTRNAIPAVVYFDKSKDLTDTLLAALNKGHEEEVKKAMDNDRKAREAAEAAAKAGADKAPAAAAGNAK